MGFETRSPPGYDPSKIKYWKNGLPVRELGLGKGIPVFKVTVYGKPFAKSERRSVPRVYTRFFPDIMDSVDFESVRQHVSEVGANIRTNAVESGIPRVEITVSPPFAAPGWGDETRL